MAARAALADVEAEAEAAAADADAEVAAEAEGRMSRSRFRPRSRPRCLTRLQVVLSSPGEGRAKGLWTVSAVLAYEFYLLLMADHVVGMFRRQIKTNARTMRKENERRVEPLSPTHHQPTH